MDRLLSFLFLWTWFGCSCFVRPLLAGGAGTASNGLSSERCSECSR
jgi:hypothetical protein